MAEISDDILYKLLAQRQAPPPRQGSIGAVFTVLFVFALLALAGWLALPWAQQFIGDAKLTTNAPAAVPSARPFPTFAPQPADNGGNVTIAPQSDPVAPPPPIEPPQERAQNTELSTPADNPGYDAGAEPGCDAACAKASADLAAELKYQQKIDALYKPDATMRPLNAEPWHPGNNPGFTSDVETMP